MQTTIKIILFCLLPCYGIGQTDTLSLEGYLQLAASNSLDKRAAHLDLEQAELNFRLFQAQLRPQLLATANLPNYARTSSEIVQPNGTVRFQPIRNNNSSLGLELTQNITQTGGTLFVSSRLQRFDDFEADDRYYNGVPARIGLFQPLFGFNPFKFDKQLEPIKREEAQRQYRADLAAIHTQATRLFFDLLYARMELDIARANRKSNQALFDIATERHALGKLSDSDLMRLRINLLSAKRDEAQALQSVKNTSDVAQVYLGRPHDSPLLYPRTPQQLDSLHIPMSLAIQQARSNRPETSTYQRQTLQAERNLAQAKGQGGFQANLTASFGFTRSAQDVEMVYRDPQQEQFFQLELSVPILDWGAQRARTDLQRKQLEFTHEQVQQQLLLFENDIARTVRQFNALQQELQQAYELQQLAAERFEITRKSYVLGAISITDLIISQQENDLSRRTYINTLGRYWETYYQLQQLTLYDFQEQTPLFIQ